MNYCKTLIKLAAAISLAILTTGVNADDQLRGAMTAVSNVASAISEKGDYSNSKWINKNEQRGSVVNTTKATGNTFKWAQRSRQNGELTAAVDAEQSKARWLIRNDAEQSKARWLIRNDAEQSKARWLIRNDAEQSKARWLIRSHKLNN